MTDHVSSNEMMAKANMMLLMEFLLINPHVEDLNQAQLFKFKFKFKLYMNFQI